MENICLVIDMDGHSIQKNFYCRELGYAELSTPRKEYGSVRFDLRPLAKLVRPEDRPTIWYCEKILGVLEFWPDKAELREGEIFRLEDLKVLVRNLWSEFKRPGKRVVAYKGGHVEKDLLEEMEIPSVDLELFGCPKYDSLQNVTSARDCGYHHHHQGSGPAHCPMRECAAFAQWIRESSSEHRRIVEEEWWE